MSQVDYEGSGIYSANLLLVPATAVPRYLDEYPGTCFNAETRELEETADLGDAPALRREDVGGPEFRSEVTRYLQYLGATNRYRGKSLKDVLSETKMQNDAPVSEFALRVEKLRGRPGTYLDVSALTPSGTGDKQTSSKTSKLLRGHPQLPIVSKTYDAYLAAVRLLPGGEERYKAVLREMQRVFKSAGSKVVTLAGNVGSEFYGEPVAAPAVPSSSSSSSAAPAGAAEHATGFASIPLLSYDPRKAKILAIEKLVEGGRLDEDKGSAQIEELIRSKPIKGTILEPIHEFSEEDAEAIRGAEPRLQKASFEKMNSEWKKFVYRGTRPTIYATNFQRAFDPFIRHLLAQYNLTGPSQGYKLK